MTTRDESRATEAARLAALHNLQAPADERCWNDLQAENERLRAALLVALQDYTAQAAIAIGEAHTQEPFEGDR